MVDTLIVQQPDSLARRLVLLFHGVGATPHDLLTLAHSGVRYRLERQAPVGRNGP